MESTTGGRRDLDQLPPSAELWCSFLNFCVSDDPGATPAPSPTSSSRTPVPAPAPESAMNALCTFLQLCDLTAAPSPSPTPEPGATGESTNDLGFNLLDICVYIGLCVVEPTPTMSPTGPPVAPTIAPTAVPTYPEPPKYDSICEFLGNCPEGAPAVTIQSPTNRPTKRNTPQPTQRPTQRPTPQPTSDALESDTAVDFLCSILGWCGNGSSGTTTSAPISVVSTPNPTPAPTRPTLLCLVSRIC